LTEVNSNAKSALRVRVSGLLVRDGRFLCVRHRKNGREYFMLPGGGADSDELLAGSLQREFLEELGMKIEVGELLFVAQTLQKETGRNILHMVFHVSSEACPTGTDLDARVVGYDWCDENLCKKTGFYPDILNLIVELLEKSEYNGLVVRYPEWID
jgi:ADP-ribose pyrophosphatase YjhB (NUDIX family)